MTAGNRPAKQAPMFHGGELVSKTDWIGSIPMASATIQARDDTSSRTRSDMGTGMLDTPDLREQTV